MKKPHKPHIMWSHQAKYDAFMAAFATLLALILYIFMG